MGTPMSPSLLSGRGSRTVSRLVSLPRLQITEAYRAWGLHKSVKSGRGSAQTFTLVQCHFCCPTSKLLLCGFCVVGFIPFLMRSINVS